MRVTWDAPSKSEYDGDILGYFIRYTRPDLKYKKLQRTDCSEENCSVEVKYLNKLTEYTITVFPFNSTSEGPESDEVMQFTAEGKPDAPEGVICEAISSKELRISWLSLPPGLNHSILMNYQVTYGKYRNYNEYSKRERTSTNEIVLHGLKKGTAYLISVLGSNSLGNGIPSSKIVCATENDGTIH